MILNRKNRNWYFKIKLVMVLVFLTFVSAGCGGGSSQNPGLDNKEIVLKIWKPFTDSMEMEGFIAGFNAKYPNIRIEYTKKNIENYENDLLNALAAGTGPDIFSINNAWLPKYLDKIQPAESTIFTYSDYKNIFLDTLTQDFTRDEKIYGTAISVDTLALYYNKDILGSNGFATPPKTWEEMARQVRLITRQDNVGYFSISGVALGTTGNINRAQDILYLLMLQAGTEPWSKDLNNPTFAQPIEKNGKQYFPGVQGLTYYTSFANTNSLNYTWNIDSDYSIDAFSNGRAALLYGYHYTRSAILEKSPNLNFDIAPAPQIDLNSNRVNFANYFGEVVSKQSPNSKAAWEFLKYMTSKENLEAYYKQYNYPASRKDLVEKQIQDPVLGVFAYSSLTAKNFYRNDQAKVDEIFLKTIDNISLYGMTPEQALTQAERQVSSLNYMNY